MTEQKKMNACEAIAAMVRDDVIIKDEDGYLYRYRCNQICLVDDKLYIIKGLSNLKISSNYTIYQYQKAKTYYKVFYHGRYYPKTISETTWYETLEKAKQSLNPGDIYICHDIREFSGVKNIVNED